MKLFKSNQSPYSNLLGDQTFMLMDFNVSQNIKLFQSNQSPYSNLLGFEDQVLATLTLCNC